MKVKRKSRRSNRPLAIALFLTVVLFGGAVFAFVYRANKNLNNGKSEKVASIAQQSTEPEESVAQVSAEEETEVGTQEKWQEGVISHNGKKYQFNFNLHTYLLMGIDVEGPVKEAEDMESGGQSDAMFLLVADSENDELSVIPINRNTITDVYTCDEEGNYTGTGKTQICVAHGFGDGKRLSCTRTVDAVSNLFYQLPIDGYFSINVDAVPLINDAIGGVEVEVLNTVTGQHDGRSITLTKGQTLTLDGDQSYVYLRRRDTEEFGSADLRLARQKQYITAYIEKLRAMSDRNSVIVNLYNNIVDYLVSDLDFSTVMQELIDYQFDDSHMYTIPGETVQGDVFE